MSLAHLEVLLQKRKRTVTTFNPFNTDVDTVLVKPSTICTWDPLFVDGRGNNAGPPYLMVS